MDINKIIKNLESSNKEDNEEDNKEDNNLDLNKNINKNINYNPIVFIPNSTGFKIWWLLGIYDSFLAQNINIQDNIS